jgi:cell division protein FtsQ
MPWSDTYTSPVLVVNGFIKENYGTLYTVNFDSYSLDSALRSPLLMDDIWQITKRIAADTFLSAQLIQVYITPERILQLIPRVGNHVIVLGDISDIDEKINKLRIFYSDGISRSGNWNDYKTIDLQFKNQIVCTKK